MAPRRPQRLVGLLVASIALLGGAWLAVELGTRTAERVVGAAPQSIDERDATARHAIELSATAPSSERALPKPPALRGRVIDAETGAPVAGQKVLLITPKKAPDRAEVEARIATLLRERVQLQSGADVQVSTDAQNVVIRLSAGVLTLPEFTSVSEQPAGTSPQQRLAILTHGLAQQPGNQGSLPLAAALTPPSAPSDPGAALRQLLEKGLVDTPPDPAAPPEPASNGAINEDEPPRPPGSESSLDGSQPGASDTLQVQGNPIAWLAVAAASGSVTGPKDPRAGAVMPRFFQASMPELTTNSWAQPGSRASVQLPSAWFLSPGRRQRLHHNRPVGDTVETTTDEDGRFEFACPESDGATLVLDGQDPIEMEPSRLDVGPAASACTVEITWKVTIRRRGFLRGRVIDADTKEPVPALAVGLRAPDVGRAGEFEYDVVTDAHGEFATPFTLRAGRVEVLFADGADQEFVVGREEIEFTAPEDAAQHLEFRVHAGPTFRFLPRLTNDEIQGDLALRFVNLAPADLASGAANPLAAWRADDLHKEDCVWFRGPVAVRREHDGPVFAEWTATDGLVFGRVELASIAPPDPNPLPVVFSISASVHGTVRGSVAHEGQSSIDEIEGALVRVLDAQGNVLGEWTTDEMGQYLIPGLEASRAATIEARHPKFGVASSPAALRNGEPATLDLTFK